ncbi:MAG: M14 family metallopeptidase [Planctomycetota bacterium]
MRQFSEKDYMKTKMAHGAVDFYFLTLVTAVISLFCSSCEASVSAVSGSKSERPFFENVDFNPAIPKPQTVIGHRIGEKAVRYDMLVRYLEVLAQSSRHVRLASYGESHKGRKLYYLTITSPDNYKRLDEIKTDNSKLSDPRTLSGPEEAKRILETMPAVAWLGYSIHGDELSSTDAAVYVAYHLVAGTDKVTQSLLDKLVIHIAPLINPDGRERYLSQLEHLTGIISSPDYQSMQHKGLWSKGRGNHYLLDLNRDWVLQTQPEVRNLTGVIHSWNPHLLIDSHEMGPYDTYLLDPPREPLNIYLSRQNLSWRKRFGSDHAAAFNRHRWSYYSKGWYSEWSPIYLNSWANLLGSIGLLYEQAGTDAASVKQPTGLETTYRQTVHHHIISSLTNLETLAANRREILRDFLAEKQWAVSDKGPHNETFLLPPAKDVSRWRSLVELIKHQGIETELAEASFEAEELTDLWGNKLEKKELPEGTLVVKSRQPHRRMLHTLLAFDPHFTNDFLADERKELENRRATRIYDVSSWNLAMAFGLEAYWAGKVPKVDSSSDTSKLLRSSSRLEDRSDYGYVIDFACSGIYPVLVRLFENDCHPRVATKPFQIEGKSYKQGAILLRANENPKKLFAVLEKICDELDINVHPVDTGLSENGPDLGARQFKLLAAPRVAIASQWPTSSTSFGSAWYLLDHKLRLRSSAVNIQGIGQIDLRKYNVLILPSSNGLDRIIDDKALKKLKRWIEEGGTLIASGNSAVFLAAKERGLSSVRLRRNVLKDLSIYKEAVQRERAARDIKIDTAHIWGTKTPEKKAENAKTPKEDSEKEKAQKDKDTKEDKDAKDTEEDIEKLKRTDEWQRIFSPGGVFLAGHVNTEHWLGFGLEERLPIMLWGKYAFLSKHPVSTVVRLDDKEQLRLSGLLWPEARERLSNTAYATVESLGNGQVVLFATDPTFRTWLPGIQRLFYNAVLLGPGMGTSQPVPW